MDKPLMKLDAICAKLKINVDSKFSVKAAEGDNNNENKDSKDILETSTCAQSLNNESIQQSCEKWCQGATRCTDDSIKFSKQCFAQSLLMSEAESEKLAEVSVPSNIHMNFRSKNRRKNCFPRCIQQNKSDIAIVNDESDNNEKEVEFEVDLAKTMEEADENDSTVLDLRFNINHNSDMKSEIKMPRICNPSLHYVTENDQKVDKNEAMDLSVNKTADNVNQCNTTDVGKVLTTKNASMQNVNCVVSSSPHMNNLQLKESSRSTNRTMDPGPWLTEATDMKNYVENTMKELLHIYGLRDETNESRTDSQPHLAIQNCQPLLPAFNHALSARDDAKSSTSEDDCLESDHDSTISSKLSFQSKSEFASSDHMDMVKLKFSNLG